MALREPTGSSLHTVSNKTRGVPMQRLHYWPSSELSWAEMKKNKFLHRSSSVSFYLQVFQHFSCLFMKRVTDQSFSLMSFDSKTFESILNVKIPKYLFNHDLFRLIIISMVFIKDALLTIYHNHQPLPWSQYPCINILPLTLTNIKLVAPCFIFQPYTHHQPLS